MIMVATSRQQASLEPRTGKRLALSLHCGAPCGLPLSAGDIGRRGVMFVELRGRFDYAPGSVENAFMKGDGS